MRAYLRLRPAHFYLLFFLLFGLAGQVQALSPAEAAEQAKAHTGGKVLKVKALGDDHYKVKVLMPNGQVRSVPIGNAAEERKDNSEESKDTDK